MWLILAALAVVLLTLGIAVETVWYLAWAGAVLVVAALVMGILRPGRPARPGQAERGAA